MLVNYIYLIHILFVAPLLIYSGYIGKELSLRCNVDDYVAVFSLLIIIGIVVFLYHGYKLLLINRFI